MTQITSPVLDTGRPDPGTIRISDHCLVASGAGRAPGRRAGSCAGETVAPQAHVALVAPGDSPKVDVRPTIDAAGRRCDGTHGSAVFGAAEFVVQPGSGEGISS